MGMETGGVIQVMKRYELKYLLDRGQAAFLAAGLRGHMEPDRYGLTSIASLYYDTPDDRLIRRSMEKPDFKEKLRLRSYGPATDASPVFLELKRKVRGIVYKRRVRSTLPAVEAFLAGADAPDAGSQIGHIAETGYIAILLMVYHLRDSAYLEAHARNTASHGLHQRACNRRQHQ